MRRIRPLIAGMEPADNPEACPPLPRAKAARTYQHSKPRGPTMPPPGRTYR